MKNKTKLVILYLVDQVLSVGAMAAALFWSAGRIDWWAAWAAVGVWVAWFSAYDVLLLGFNPELAQERLAPPKDSKRWDRALLSLLRLGQLARYILAGLDQRHGWTGDFSIAAQWIGLGGCLLGYGLLGWALASNRYFSQVVRIQAERGHAVAQGGPYRWVRHPGYLGMIVFEPAMSALLGSWPALAVGGLCAALVILRTALEDRTLMAELDGYAAYAQKVRYRLVPQIW